MEKRNDARTDDKPATEKTAPAPMAPDALSASERQRRAARVGRDGGGRPLRREETAPGERGDGPYGDSEPGTPEEQPGV
jgi:hypothetical protein